MPGFSILKLFTLFGIVSAWSEKALADGKITLTEAAELAERLGPLLGVPVHLEADLARRVSSLNPEPSETGPPMLDDVDGELPGDRPHPRN